MAENSYKKKTRDRKKFTKKFHEGQSFGMQFSGGQFSGRQFSLWVIFRAAIFLEPGSLGLDKP